MSGLDNLLLKASKKGILSIVQTSLKEGADVNNYNHWITPLMWATINGHTEVVKVLLDAGADVAITEVDGYDALSYATDLEYRDIIKLLKEAGAE